MLQAEITETDTKADAQLVEQALSAERIVAGRAAGETPLTLSVRNSPKP